MRKQLRRIAFFALPAALIVSLCFYVNSRYVFPVLMYHSVAPVAKNMLTLSPESFERQMAFLKSNGYHVLTFGQAAEVIQGRRKPAKSLTITFDDGKEDNYRFAFPVLKKYGLPATIFLIYAKIGTPGFLDWGEIREMQSSGLITFGSHTLHHLVLTKLSEQEIAEEVAGSKKLLEEKLGEKVDFFAYPLGIFDARSRKAVVDAGYLAAVATNPGHRSSDNDRFLIKRLRISENSRFLPVFVLESSGYYNLIREKRQKRGE